MPVHTLLLAVHNQAREQVPQMAKMWAAAINLVSCSLRKARRLRAAAVHALLLAVHNQAAAFHFLLLAVHNQAAAFHVLLLAVHNQAREQTSQVSKMRVT